MSNGSANGTGGVSGTANGRELDRVLIFDTTLRDGEQSPGCSMTTPEKLRVADALARLGVDIIEAGFPIASEGDFEAVRAIAERMNDPSGPIIAGLARCRREDIQRAAEAVRPAARPRVHVFLATSAIHREFKLEMAREEIVRRAVEGLKQARELCEDVEFSPEDATRTEPDYLAEVVEKAIEAGATTLNIPDTVGYTTPAEYEELMKMLIATCRGADRVVFSAHCHDDLGMAVANSLAAIRGGARQIECTINGIGERAGNCALEEIVMAVRTRSDVLGVRTDIDTARLYPTSRLVSAVTGSMVQRNKAIVGENAFAHEAGIHQHGVIANRATYEIMDPTDVGFDRNSLVLGKHSGKHAVRERLEALGYQVAPAELDTIVKNLKALADRKKVIYDADLEAIMLDQDPLEAGPWKIEELSVTSGTGSHATATITLGHVEDDRQVTEAAVGDGPVHAIFTVLTRATGVDLSLVEFQVRSVTIGEDAQGEAVVDIRAGTTAFRGQGLSTDIVEAAALAVLDVVNRVCRLSEHRGQAAERGGWGIPMRD